MDYDSFLELLKKRRSIRAFKKDPIPEDHIRMIAESVRLAPSGLNTQPWEVIIVNKPALKDRIAGIIREEVNKMPPRPMPALKPGQKPTSPTGFLDAPVFMLLFGDTRIRAYGPPMDDDSWNALLTSNLALGFHNILLSANALDLGAQWVSMVSRPNMAPGIKKLLGVPDAMRFYAMAALGHPDMEPAPKKMRALDKMIHYNECTEGDFRTEDEVKAFCAP